MGQCSQTRALGYSHSSTSIFISKKKYFILVIEILYSIPIFPVPVLSLSHTLYPLFHILFHPLSFSLTNVFSLRATVALQCLAFSLSRARSVLFFCAAGTLPSHLQARGADDRYATSGVPSPLPLRGADSLSLATAPPWLAGAWLRLLYSLPNRRMLYSQSLAREYKCSCSPRHGDPIGNPQF